MPALNKQIVLLKHDICELEVDVIVHSTNEQLNHQKHIIFEGFKPNGLQIRNQHIFLHRIAYVKISFDLFL